MLFFGEYVLHNTFLPFRGLSIPGKGQRDVVGS